MAVTLNSPVLIEGQKKYPCASEIVWQTVEWLGPLTLIWACDTVPPWGSVTRPEIRPAGSAATMFAVAKAIKHTSFKARKHGETVAG